MLENVAWSTDADAVVGMIADDCRPNCCSWMDRWVHKCCQHAAVVDAAGDRSSNDASLDE